MGGKWLEILRQMAPEGDRVGLMLYPEPPNFGYLNRPKPPRLRSRSIWLGSACKAPPKLNALLAAFAAEPHGSLVVAPNVVTFATATSSSRWPHAIACLRSIHSLFMPSRWPGFLRVRCARSIRQGAGYVDKILKGAKPPICRAASNEIRARHQSQDRQRARLDVPLHLQQLADEIIE